MPGLPAVATPVKTSLHSRRSGKSGGEQSQPVRELSSVNIS